MKSSKKIIALLILYLLIDFHSFSLLGKKTLSSKYSKLFKRKHDYNCGFSLNCSTQCHAYDNQCNGFIKGDKKCSDNNYSATCSSDNPCRWYTNRTLFNLSLYNKKIIKEYCYDKCYFCCSIDPNNTNTCIEKTLSTKVVESNVEVKRKDIGQIWEIFGDLYYSNRIGYDIDKDYDRCLNMRGDVKTKCIEEVKTELLAIEESGFTIENCPTSYWKFVQEQANSDNNFHNDKNNSLFAYEVYCSEKVITAEANLQKFYSRQNEINYICNMAITSTIPPDFCWRKASHSCKSPLKKCSPLGCSINKDSCTMASITIAKGVFSGIITPILNLLNLTLLPGASALFTLIDNIVDKSIELLKNLINFQKSMSLDDFKKNYFYFLQKVYNKRQNNKVVLTPNDQIYKDCNSILENTLANLDKDLVKLNEFKESNEENKKSKKLKLDLDLLQKQNLLSIPIPNAVQAVLQQVFSYLGNLDPTGISTIVSTFLQYSVCDDIYMNNLYQKLKKLKKKK